MASERPSYLLEQQIAIPSLRRSIWMAYGTYRSLTRARERAARLDRPCRIVEYCVVWRSHPLHERAPEHPENRRAARSPTIVAARQTPRRLVMADRVSASITIGGELPAASLPDLLAAIESEGVATEWNGEPFTVDQLPDDAPLTLMAHEVAWGRFDELESFCVAHGLPFARWSGGYGGQWGAERTVFTGSDEPRSYVADEDDHILIDRSTVERLGTIDAVLAYFEAAEFVIPPLRITDREASGRV